MYNASSYLRQKNVCDEKKLHITTASLLSQFIQDIHLRYLASKNVSALLIYLICLCVDVVVAFNKIQRVVFTLRSNQSFLMETMRLREGLIDQLRLSDCLTDVQSRLLNRQTVTSGKRKLNGRNSSPDLLHFMRSFDGAKRSDCFRCFRQSGHKLVTRVIDNGGGLPLNFVSHFIGF